MPRPKYLVHAFLTDRPLMHRVYIARGIPRSTIHALRLCREPLDAPSWQVGLRRDASFYRSHILGRGLCVERSLDGFVSRKRTASQAELRGQWLAGQALTATNATRIDQQVCVSFHLAVPQKKRVMMAMVPSDSVHPTESPCCTVCQRSHPCLPRGTAPWPIVAHLPTNMSQRRGHEHCL